MILKKYFVATMKTQLIFLTVVICLNAVMADTDDSTKSKEKVLVLGSGGFIGQHLVKWLESNGYEIAHVKNRNHLDLRTPGALDVFNDTKIGFCFFLACEVGGSKFIENPDDNLQLGIIESNIQMYQVVLPWLKQRKIPFIFTSSYLQGTHNPYGAVKRIGEQWLLQLGGIGKIQRLWNVYGFEEISIKSHVMSDWVSSCVAKGQVASLSDGTELRQFVFVQDVAAALGLGMINFNKLGLISDVSSGVWVSMREVGSVLEQVTANVTGHRCQITYASKPANPREHVSPDMQQPLHAFWQPKSDIKAGLTQLVQETADRYNKQSLHTEL